MKPYLDIYSRMYAYGSITPEHTIYGRQQIQLKEVQSKQTEVIRTIKVQIQQNLKPYITDMSI